MGLLYPFPVSEHETDFVVYQSEPIKKIELYTYGLPYVFWLYALAITLVTGLLTMAIWNPLLTLLEQAQFFDYLLIVSFLTTLFLAFLALIVFLLLGFKITVTKDHLTKDYQILRKTFYKKTFALTNTTLIIEHFLDSPNVARIEGKSESVGFQNRGYFELKLFSQKENVKYFIDRHSRLADLEKLKLLLLKAAPQLSD
jgi:hypothetical protein